MDVSGAYPTFQVRDIASPYGLLRDTIPIPGDIVQRMAESIVELQQAYSPTILVGPPTSLVFVVNEGQGFSEPLTIDVSNNGSFGSILDVSLSTDVPFLSVQPPTLGGVSTSMTAHFEAMVDSTSLTAEMSPIDVEIVLQDARATNSPVSFPVTITVLPKAHITLVPTTLTFYAVAPPQGVLPQPIPAQQFELQNTGLPDSLLTYQIAKLTGCTLWLTNFSPPVGEVVGGATQPITVSVRLFPNMNPGTYTETLRVSGYSANIHADLLVRFVVS